AAHLPPLERHHGWKEIFSPEARRELRGGANAFDPVDVYRARYAETAGAPQLARLQDVDFGVYLVDDLLVKTDRASMAHSLEARVPFLDPLVTNLAFALPTRLKVHGLAKKILLRKAVEPLLPQEVVHGRKRGFSIPAAAWLRGELEPFARETLSAENLRRQGFSAPAPAARLRYDDEPVAVVEVTEARVLPAHEIDLAFALDEGEGFESVDDWRVAHERFFERPIGPETPIVAVRFRVVERL